jgi:hypothetical protein
VCGNDTVDCGEECDDGPLNGQPGSSCLAELCRFGQICSTEIEGPCIACADAVECDPLGLCGGMACEAGVCTPTTLSCDDTNPCTSDGCDALTGCTHELRNPAEVAECDDGDPCTDPLCNMVSGCQQTEKTGFESVECRLTDLDAMLAHDGVDDTARSGLGTLIGSAQSKVDSAEAAQETGKTKKVKAGLKKARKKLVSFGKKVVKFEPTHITDPDVAALLSEKSFDATQRVDDLRAELGL